MRRVAWLLLAVWITVCLWWCPACGGDEAGESDNTPDGPASCECRWAQLETGTSHGYLESVWGSSATDVFVVGLGGAILHYNGSGWTRMESGTDHDLYAVWGSSPTDVYAAGYPTPSGSGPILHYDGSAWSQVFGGDGTSHWYSFYGLWGTSAWDIFVVGEGSETRPSILHYDGSTWSPVDAGGTYSLVAIWGTSATDIFVAGSDAGKRPVILHYDGSNWSPMAGVEDAMARFYPAICDIWGSSPSDIYAAVYFQGLIHYDGQEWRQVDIDEYQPAAVWGSSGADVYLVGSTESMERGVLHYDGKSWRLMDLQGAGGGLYGMWGSGACDVFAVGAGIMRCAESS